MHWWKRGYSRVLCCFAVGLYASPSVAQVEMPAPFIGLAIGGGEGPTALLDGCGGNNGRTSIMLAELRAGAPVGAVVLESRTTASGEPPGRDDCLLVVPSYADGLHRSRLRGFGPGASLATDFRIRYQGATRFPWVLSAGGGWMWTQEIPFVLAGIGTRTAGRVRAAIDLEWSHSRVPFDVVTQEWRCGTVLRELARERDHEWQSGWSLRLGAEYALRLKP